MADKRDRTAYMKAYQRRWYREVMKVRRETWFAENGPCVDCGSWDKLELDHVDPSTKENHAVWSWAESRRIAELAKCRPRCKPCHLKKTIAYMFEIDIWKSTRKNIVNGTSRCSKCYLDLPVDFFHKDKHMSNGLYAACKGCRSLYPSRGYDALRMEREARKTAA